MNPVRSLARDKVASLKDLGGATSNGMKLDKEQFEFIKPLTWDEVAEIWRNNEINEEHWKTYYESKGHKSWEEWRKKYVDAYAALKKNWYLVKVKNPLASVPNFHGGNYTLYNNFARLNRKSVIFDHPR